MRDNLEQLITDGDATLIYRRGSGNSYEICEIEVPGARRRQGVGRSMVDLLIKQCEDEGVDRIYAITRAENRIAQEFYEELNFVGIPIWNFYGVKNEAGVCTVDAVMYVRDLERHP